LFLVHVHSASISRTRSTDLVLRRDLNSIPVLDHPGVVLLNHRHACSALLGNGRERDAGVDLERDEARSQVSGPGAAGCHARVRRNISAVRRSLLTAPDP